MNWTELLKAELESTFDTTAKLLAKVDDSTLGWRPPLGDNWMSVGQLLRHMGDGCGAAIRGCITGDWGLPPDLDPAVLTQLPTLDQLPTLESVAEALSLLQQDREKAFAALALASEEELAGRLICVPWDAREKVLGYWLLHMIEHLKLHKSQLFYYLKLQGLNVNTADLWGM